MDPNERPERTFQSKRYGGCPPFALYHITRDRRLHVNRMTYSSLSPECSTISEVVTRWEMACSTPRASYKLSQLSARAANPAVLGINPVECDPSIS